MSSAIYIAVCIQTFTLLLFDPNFDPQLTKEKDRKQTSIPLHHSGDAALEEGLLENVEDERELYVENDTRSHNDVKVPTPWNEDDVQADSAKPA